MTRVNPPEDDEIEAANDTDAAANEDALAEANETGQPVDTGPTIVYPEDWSDERVEENWRLEQELDGAEPATEVAFDGELSDAEAVVASHVEVAHPAKDNGAELV